MEFGFFSYVGVYVEVNQSMWNVSLARSTQILAYKRKLENLPYLHSHGLKFKHLGSMIQYDWEMGRDVDQRTQTGWMKWRNASSVTCCYRIIPLKPK